MATSAQEKVYLNGRILPTPRARIDPGDRGLLLGDGVFETIGIWRGRPFHANAHFDRLARGAANLGIEPPLDGAGLTDALHETLAANRIERRDAAARVTLTRGAGGRGLSVARDTPPTLVISTSPVTPLADEPARVRVAELRRNEHSPLASIKSLNYLDSVLARAEAEAQGFDEAIVLNTAGRVASAAAGNLFVVGAGTLITPPPEEGVLAGITRHAVLELAAAAGIECAERPVTLDELAGADEAFLTNSLIGVRSLGVASVPPGEVAFAAPGPITRRLRQSLVTLFRD